MQELATERDLARTRRNPNGYIVEKNTGLLHRVFCRKLIGAWPGGLLYFKTADAWMTWNMDPVRHVYGAPVKVCHWCARAPDRKELRARPDIGWKKDPDGEGYYYLTAAGQVRQASTGLEHLMHADLGYLWCEDAEARSASAEAKVCELEALVRSLEDKLRRKEARQARQQPPPPPPPQQPEPPQTALQRAYLTLHVAEGAPLPVCNAAYKALMLGVHPDVGGSTAQATALNLAIETIRRHHKKSA